MQNLTIRSSRISVPKPVLIALVLISAISTAVAFAVVTEWPLTLRMKVGGTDFTVYELHDNLTRIGETHEHDFDVLVEYDSASWFIEIENLSPYSIWVNYTVIDLPDNLTVDLMYDYDDFDMPSEWTDGTLLELQSTGVYQGVVVKIMVCNQGAESGSYTFQVVIRAV